MEEEIRLSTVLCDSKKTPYLSSFQITLNHCEISEIDKVPNRFGNITKLFLSHNKISSLSGIEQFKFLTHLSIGYNRIEDYRELNKIADKEALKHLIIQGNPLENHPNHKVLVLEMFPNLEKLNNLKVDKNLRELLDQKTTVVQKNLITFLYYLFDEINNMEILLTKVRISNELLTRTFSLESKTQLAPQEKLDHFLSSQKNLSKFKSLFNFQRIEGLKAFLNSRKFSSKTDYLSILLNISEILIKLYGPFDHKIINNRQAFFTIYKCLYIELIEKLNKRLDKNLERFLVKKVLANEFVSPERFSEDDEYALNCMLAAFYQLLPTQAFINDVICYDKKNKLLSPSQEYFEVRDHFSERGFSNLSPDNLSNRIYKWQNAKEIWKYKREEVINELEINENNPENIKNVLLIHFPIFPLNKNYMESILEILTNKFQLIVTFYDEIVRHLEGKIDLKPPKMPPVNERTIRNQLENEFLERSLDTLRSTGPQSEPPKNHDKENNTVETWNKEATLKTRKLEQTNQVFSYEKAQVLTERNVPKENHERENSQGKKKVGTLKKSILKRKNQETSTIETCQKNQETSTSEALQSQQKLEKRRRNMMKLCSKILKEKIKSHLVWGFDLLKKNMKLRKKEAKEILVRKKKHLDKLFEAARKFILGCEKKSKFKALSSMKKYSTRLEKSELLRKNKLRKFFNILLENHSEKKLKIAQFYEKMLKCKVFFYLFREFFNKKKMKEQMKKLIDFYRKKQLKSGFSKWWDRNLEIRDISAQEREMMKYRLSLSSRLQNLLTSKDTYSTSQQQKNEENSYSRSRYFGKTLKNLSGNNEGRRVCNCKHYFRKCGACETIKFN